MENRQTQQSTQNNQNKSYTNKSKYATWTPLKTGTRCTGRVSILCFFRNTDELLIKSQVQEKDEITTFLSTAEYTINF